MQEYSCILSNIQIFTKWVVCTYVLQGLRRNFDSQMDVNMYVLALAEQSNLVAIRCML